jgi:Flp pilus assembly protein TadG
MTRIGKPSERGNALLEFALGWSVLWLIFSGLFQFGYSFYTYNVLMTAVANAAEIGSKMSYDTGTPGTFTTALQNMVLYGDTATGTSTVVPKLLAANVGVAVTLDATGIPRDVTITIVNFKIDGFFQVFTINGKPRATTMYFGQVTCATC